MRIRVLRIADGLSELAETSADGEIHRQTAELIRMLAKYIPVERVALRTVK